MPLGTSSEEIVYVLNITSMNAQDDLAGSDEGKGSMQPMPMVLKVFTLRHLAGEYLLQWMANHWTDHSKKKVPARSTITKRFAQEFPDITWGIDMAPLNPTPPLDLDE